MATAGRKPVKAAVHVALRVTAAVAGGFGFTTASVALSAVALPVLFGMARGEAVLLSTMLGFILYLTLLLWAFAEPRAWRVWFVFLAGGAAAFGLSQWLAPMLAASGG
jgi:hypothetical protein